MILGEKLSGVELLGCALVFVSVILSQLSSAGEASRKEKGEQNINADKNSEEKEEK